jgi:hypothetical protein
MMARNCGCGGGEAMTVQLAGGQERFSGLSGMKDDVLSKFFCTDCDKSVRTI